MKVISIISFAPKINLDPERFQDIYEYTEHYEKNVGRVQYLDVDEPVKRVFFYDEFALNQAERLVPFYDGENVDVELWRPYRDIKEVHEKNINGVNCKLIPAVVQKDRFGRKHTISNLMIEMLKNEVRKGTVLITNFPSNFTQYVLEELGPNVPVIANKRGFWFERFKRQDYKTIKLPYHFLKKGKQEKLFRKHYIDAYGSVSITKEFEYLESLGFKNYFYHQDGVDFDFFVPAENKYQVRMDLGLEPDKIILMYTGKFYSTKGADKLIAAYNNMPNRQEVQLVLIGGGQTDEYYQYGVDSGAIVIEKTKREKLMKYYQAADIYIMPIPESNSMRTFGGIGRSTIEALACGTPVITNQLMHFEGTEEESDRIGSRYNDENDIHLVIKKVLNQYQHYSNCREIAKKYYEMDRCTLRLKSKVDSLFNQYYKS